MAMLADRVDGVVGVDTHRDTLTAAAVTAIGGLLGQLVVTADAAGTSGCWTSPALMFPAGGALPWKARAAMALG
jgi:transposase